MYQCRNCGGGLRFDIASQQLKCDFCQSLFPASEFQEDLNGAQEENEFEVTKFICNQCGAEIISQDNTAASFCSFCGASTILSSRLSREKKPDAIIPFKKSKEDCIQAYHKLMKHSYFAPNDLKDAKAIDGFRGIYMPYWVYDVRHQGNFRLPGEKYSRQGSYDITKHYDLCGNINASYQGITHDAASEFSDDISEALAPYNVREMQHFNGAFLSGFYADTSDVDPTIYDSEVLKFTADISYQQIKKNPAFSGYSIKQAPTAGQTPFPVQMPHPHYALFPVWFMSYRKNDRVAYVTVNGQTGKIAADVPIDFKKYAIGSLILALPIFIIMNFFSSITASGALLLSLFASVISLVISLVEISNIANRDLGVNDKGLWNSKNRPAGKRESIPSIIKKRWKEKKELPGIHVIIFTMIISLLVLFMHPVSDYFYYGATFLSIIAIFLTIIDIIKDYNTLVTRKLPQFNRTGGDDSVK